MSYHLVQKGLSGGTEGGFKAASLDRPFLIYHRLVTVFRFRFPLSVSVSVSLNLRQTFWCELTPIYKNRWNNIQKHY
jgi:hypothetical protein